MIRKCFGLIGIILSAYSLAYPLPPKEVFKKISEKQVLSSQNIRAEKYEVIDSRPRLHGGIGFDRVKQRVRILEPDANFVRAYGVDSFRGGKSAIGEGALTPIQNLTQTDNWVYLDQLNSSPYFLRHAQGRFEVRGRDLRFVPEDPEVVFWQIRNSAPLTGGVRMQKNAGLLAWSQFAPGVVYLPPAAQVASLVSFETEGEWVRFFDCPSGEQFVGIQNYKSNYFRIVFFSEGWTPQAYALFDISSEKNGAAVHELTNAIMWDNCTHFLVVGSQGVSRVVFDAKSLRE